MFEFYDEINEIEEEERRKRRLRKKRWNDLTKEEVNRMTNETTSRIEIAPPEFGIPEELLKEGIHVGNN